MLKKVLLGIVSGCLFIVFTWPVFSQGVDPMPLKAYLNETIQQINSRLYTAQGTSGVYVDVIRRFEEIRAPQGMQTNAALEVQTIGILDRITSFPSESNPILLNEAVENLIDLGFATPPDMFSCANEASRILEHMTAGLFNPQPEPPGKIHINTVLPIVSQMSELVTNSTHHQVPAVGGIFSVMERILAVLFIPQPEPPGRLLIGMYSIIDLMSQIPALNGGVGR